MTVQKQEGKPFQSFPFDTKGSVLLCLYGFEYPEPRTPIDGPPKLGFYHTQKWWEMERKQFHFCTLLEAQGIVLN